MCTFRSVFFLEELEWEDMGFLKLCGSTTTKPYSNKKSITMRTIPSSLQGILTTFGFVKPIEEGKHGHCLNLMDNY